MSEYNMTRLSNKQDLLGVHIKSLNDINELLMQMIIEGDMHIDVMEAVQDICKEVQECAKRIKDASEDISSYAFLAAIELKNQDNAKKAETITLKSTLDSWDAAEAANAAAEAEKIAPVVDNVEEAVGNGQYLPIIRDVAGVHQAG